MQSPEERTVQIVSDPVKRTVLAVLSETENGLTVHELASQLLRSDAIPGRSEAPNSPFQSMVVSLHHRHLPQLEDWDLVDYDRSQLTATISDAEEETWNGIEALYSAITLLSPAAEQTTILHSRQEVYEHARALADRAMDELFLLYFSDELLDEACLPYAKRAIDRGVTFHAGVKDESARTFFTEQLPEATVWEPQMDWADGPIDECPQISRLVLADRSHMVLGMWDDPTAPDPSEIAIAASGQRNPLVALVRELLGPRVTHLDLQRPIE